MNKIINKLILGTAQFGLQYGINNQLGKPATEDVYEILDYAYQVGVSTLDTAEVYGESSKTIGGYHAKREFKFNMITKFKPIGSIFSVEDWVTKTTVDLKLETLYGCLFHSFTDYSNNPEWVKRLEECRIKDKIQHIGISIYTNQEFEKAIDDYAITLIQLPYNLLDNFNIRGDLIKKAKAKGKIIHVRSVFLQGLFFMSAKTIPNKLQSLLQYIEYIHAIAKEYNISVEALALNYVINNENIDGVIIGVDSISQLHSNVDALSSKLSDDLIIKMDSINVKEIELLNPTNWK